MGFSIRKARYEDAANMADIHSRSWKAAYQGIVPDEAIEQKNAMREMMWKRWLSGKNDAYIAFVDDKPMGIMSLMMCNDLDSPNAGEIGLIYLHPDYYHKGYGKKMMDYGLKKLHEKEYDVAVVWVLKENGPARKFYEKCGFERDGAQKEVLMGIPLTEIRYRRRI